MTNALLNCEDREMQFSAMTLRSMWKYKSSRYLIRVLVLPAVVFVFLFLVLRARSNSLLEQEARNSFFALLPEHLDSKPVTNSSTCGCDRQLTNERSDSNHQLDSSCDDYATARGPHQNVVSYSFYGRASGEYAHGIEKNVKQVALMYPGWIIRVYHSVDTNDTVELQYLCRLWCNYSHLDFCQVGRLPPPLGDQSQLNGMLWRFFVLGDALVDRFIVRDLDSAPSQREVSAVRDWIASNVTWHFMHDHPSHNTAIMGGMWGGINRNLQLMTSIREKLIDDGNYSYLKGYDQKLLLDYVWPTAKKTMDFVRHDSFLCQMFANSIPFPTRRQNGEFVGAPELLSNYSGGLFDVCPEKCRPKDHLDWIHC